MLMLMLMLMLMNLNLLCFLDHILHYLPAVLRIVVTFMMMPNDGVWGPATS